MGRKDVAAVIADMRALGHPAMAAQARRFFKTGPGEYGEGDEFLGIRVPVLRARARRYRALSAADAFDLLRSPLHEIRLLALLILVQRYRSDGSAERSAIYERYLASTARINNWDLVDSSAEHIVGAHLLARSRRPLLELARSKLLWERRIAIIATFHFIRRGDFDDTLRIAGMLVADRHDLIHKAVGWMLREVGKRDRAAEDRFLDRHAAAMPRTMLRYAIERFPEPDRQAYLRAASVLRS